MNKSLLSRRFLRSDGIQYLWGKGPSRAAKIVVNRLFDRWFDIRYGTDTAAPVDLNELAIESDNKERGRRYQAAPARSLRQLLRMLPLAPGSVMVDLGCGKGRVLLVAAMVGRFSEIIGIEFSPELCRIAENNIAILRRRSGVQANIRVLLSDVAAYRVEDYADTFFLFNPFDDVILERFLANLKESLIRKPRVVRIIYYNPVHSDTLRLDFALLFHFVIAGEDYLVFGNN